MMRKLNKCFLDYGKTFPYFQDSLEEANTLSSELLKSTSSIKGRFFTLLPENANLERLYEFRDGIILPQNPLIKHENSNSFYSITPNIRDELSLLIWRTIVSSKDLIPIFDDILVTEPKKSVRQALALYYGKEIYYTMSRCNTSAELIRLCFWASHASWHSLCVLTKLDIQSLEGETLFLEDLTEICLNAELILVGAYDGEGYIFWERTPDFFPENI